MDKYTRDYNVGVGDLLATSEVYLASKIRMPQYQQGIIPS
jgi:hypothetical protein